MTTRNPMAEFQLPTSTYRSEERTPPEVEELSILLSTAVQVTPDIAPLLVLGAVTGIRRGELVGIPVAAVAWRKNQITIASAVTSSGKIKTTKTRRSRTFHIDAETTAMLKRHYNQMEGTSLRRRSRARRRCLPLQPYAGLLDSHAAGLPHEASRRIEGLPGD